MDSPLSSHSSTRSASDTEEYNTSKAHLHFGPLKSPEKKLAAMAAQRVHMPRASSQSRTRRSPRLSSRCPVSQFDEQGNSSNLSATPYVDGSNEDGKSDSIVTGEEAPGYEPVLKDEPPSLLLTRIISAQSNPSPPPSPSGQRLIHEGDEPTLLVMDTSEPTLDEDSPALLKFPPLIKVPEPKPPDDVLDAVDATPAESNVPPRVDTTTLDDTFHSNEGGSGTHDSSCLLTPGNTPIVRNDLRSADDPVSAQSMEPTSGDNNSLDVILDNPPPEGIEATEEHVTKRQHENSEQSVRCTSLVHVNTEAVTQGFPGGADKQDDGTREREKDELSGHRLDSLSPFSSSLLEQLIPSVSNHSVPTNADSVESSRAGRIFAPSWQMTAAPSTPVRSTGPVRFLSPVRLKIPQSPQKVKLQPADLEDPMRTPARRIPIAEAVAQGHISPQKAARLVAPSTNAADTNHTPLLSIPPSDSPARRVFIASDVRSQDTAKGHARLPSPIKGTASRVIVPGSASSQLIRGQKEPPQDIISRQMSPMKLPLPSTSRNIKVTKLPFPLLASEKEASRPKASSRIEHEANELKLTASPRPLPSIKPGLKRPSSKIPRSVKPYARPMPITVKKRTPGVIRLVPPAPPSSTNVISIAAASTSTQPPDDQGNSGHGDDPVTRSTPQAHPGLISLKRKRRDSPAVRQQPEAVAQQQSPLPERVNSALASASSNPVSTSITEAHQMAHAEVIAREGAHSRNDDEALEKTTKVSSLEAPPIHHDGEMNNTGLHTILMPPLSSEPARRRTTRTRKPMSTASRSEINSTQSHRRPNGRSRIDFDDGFIGMTAVALRALTTSNTEKNQKYVAAKLEMEVVRKAGNRPDSPGMKVRSIAQRDKEAKGKERRERAERRAKRGSDSHLVEEPSESEGQNSPSPSRHRKGPGDEEPYDSPTPEDNVAKRLRLGRDHYQPNGHRRVKWDKGLATTIYLDEVKLGSRKVPKEHTIKKGCLAAASKAVVLDNLGNHPDASVPLLDLEEESIVVKKFVYDTDIEPPQQLLVVKNTRLRVKKNKDKQSG